MPDVCIRGLNAFVFVYCPRPSPYVYFPFGIGHRICIGRAFAMVRTIYCINGHLILPHVPLLSVCISFHMHVHCQDGSQGNSGSALKEIDLHNVPRPDAQASCRHDHAA